MRPAIVSTTLVGPGTEKTVGEAIASIAPHVDAVLLIAAAGDRSMAAVAAAIQAAHAAGNDAEVVRWWPWRDDYAAARNELLHFAEQSEADWAINVDADETFEGGEHLRRILTGLPPAVQALHVQVDPGGGAPYWQPRCIRIPCAHRWVGATHEVIAIPDAGKSTTMRVRERPRTEAQERAKAERDVPLLERMVRERPHEPRWSYYLAEALLWVGRGDDAINAFLARMNAPGDAEERARAYLRFAQVISGLHGDHARALEACAAGMAFWPTPELAYEAAQQCEKLGMAHKAVAWAAVACGLGDSLFTRQRVLPAREVFEDAAGLALRQLNGLRREGAHDENIDRLVRVFLGTHGVDPASG